MKNKITVLVFFVIFIIFVQAAAKPVFALNSPADSIDRQLSQVVIKSPENGSKHNYFPAFSGTLVANSSTGENGERQTGDVVEVKVCISADNKVWNGREWLVLPYSEDQFLLSAEISGENWSLSSNLPAVPKFADSDPKTTVKNYNISVQTIDNAGNKSYAAQISIRVEPLELMIFDANRQFIGVDLSGNSRITTAESAKLAGLISFDNLKTGTSPADINAFINSFGDQMLNLYSRFRIYAVADGTTKLLVVAKGYSPGKVEFQSSPTSEFASKCNVNSEAAEIPPNQNLSFPENNNPQMSAAIDRMYASIKRQLKKFSQICATGTISGDNFDVLDSYRKSDNEFYWFGVYTVPPDVAPNLPNTFLGQAMSLEAVFTPDAAFGNFQGQPQPPASAPLFLKRPPVLLVHGLSDKASSWDPVHNTILEDNGFDVRLLDYRNTNGKSFQTNRIALLSDTSEYDDSVIVDGAETDEFVHIKSEGIKQILADYRKQGIAISKVDVVGHSMGGNLARVFDAQPENRSDNNFNYDNFNQGYIRRLITIGTPHLGSNVANILNEEVRLHGTVSCGSAALSHEGNQEASVDLAIGSAALLQIGQTRIPSHAIYAVASTETVTGLYRDRYVKVKGCIMLRPIQGMLPLGKVNDPPRHNAFIRSICAGVPCDWTVSVISQQGGLSASYTSTIPQNINHGEEIGSIEIRERVRDLLMGGEENFNSEGFPAVVATTAPPNSLCMFPEALNCTNALKSIEPPKNSIRKAVITPRKNPSSKSSETNISSSRQAASPIKMSPSQLLQIKKTASESIDKMQKNVLISPEQFEKSINQAPPFRVFSGGSLFQMKVPKNWRETTLSSLSTTFSPENNIDSGSGIFRGMAVEATRDKWQSIEQARKALIQAAIDKKPFLHAESPTSGAISNHRASFVKLTGQSASGDSPESVIFGMTLLKDGNLFYIAVFFPEQESANYKAIFTQIVDSIEIKD